jgi:hypothetical protein
MREECNNTERIVKTFYNGEGGWTTMKVLHRTLYHSKICASQLLNTSEM